MEGVTLTLGDGEIYIMVGRTRFFIEGGLEKVCLATPEEKSFSEGAEEEGQTSRRKIEGKNGNRGL